MSSMKVISKQEALTIGCAECADFFKSHETVGGPAAYISDTLECKKCKLQVDMMGEKIATIWKVF
jgi:hypothetical protein